MGRFTRRAARAERALVVLGATLLCLCGGIVGAQEEGAAPAPRFDDGRVNLGPRPGETGLWGVSQSRLVMDPDAYDANPNRIAPIHIDDVPLQPWARALTNHRHALYIASEPYTRCKPTGGPRQIMSPYGKEFVQVPELERVFIFTISNSMSYRTIFMDGREHPKGLRPTYMGHSVGHWEGDTLVVDTVGMNERNWMNRDALPHTEQLHLIERFTRVSHDVMEYEVTIDDPGAYTAPWTSGYTLQWEPNEEMFEYMCQENNISPAAMIGEGRLSRIVP